MASTTLGFGLTPRLFPQIRHRLPLRSPITSPRHASITRASATSASEKKRVVFLGTPPVAANTLQKLHDASQSPMSSFSLCAVVTQPPAPAGRKRVLTKSPVHMLADDLNIAPVLTPERASDAMFLRTLSELAPDLCVTAAYGNFLPQKFLDLPPFGTLNIHPSLLPAFRGAAPVPRALESGVPHTGVCVLKTVLKMDAGPVVARVERKLNGDEQAPAILEELFVTGTDALLDVLPAVWAGSAPLIEQDDTLASHAPKIAKEEARLTFTETASIVHNKVRAFAGWPGTWADFEARAADAESSLPAESLRLKIMETRVLRHQGGMCLGVHGVTFDGDAGCLVVTCDDGSRIGVYRVQPPGKKGMDAQSFWNGLRGKELKRKHVPH